MGSQSPLGEFELLVVLAVMHRPGDAYAVTISEEIGRRTGRVTSRGALYVTLERLVEKGLLTSTLSSPGPERGGRRRRYYDVTRAGREAAQATRDALQEMWAGLEVELERP